MSSRTAYSRIPCRCDDHRRYIEKAVLRSKTRAVSGAAASQRWFDQHVQITSNSRFKNDKFVKTHCFTIDDAPPHAAEKARREIEERLAATYEAATVGISESDRNGNLPRVNTTLTAITGRAREELLRVRSSTTRTKRIGAKTPRCTLGRWPVRNQLHDSQTGHATRRSDQIRRRPSSSVSTKKVIFDTACACCRT